MWAAIKDFFSKPLPVFLGHTLIALALLLLAFVGSTITVRYGRNEVNAATGALMPTQVMTLCQRPDQEATEALLPNLKEYTDSEAQKQRIRDQAMEIVKLQCAEAKLVASYIGNYYMALTLSVLFGGIAAITLFLVGPKGWAASNPYLVNVMILSGAIAAFYGAFPSIYKQAEMTAAHKMQLLRYASLLDGMRTHIATPEIVPRACVKETGADQVGKERYKASQFIACTDDALAAVDFPFGLGPSHAPDYGVIGRATSSK